MKVERILYGMQTSDGKILTKYSSGVMSCLQPKSRDALKALKIDKSGESLWFKTEQIIAYPVIIEVAAKDPTQGGRTWVQNQVFLISIYDFVSCVKSGRNPFDVFTANLLPELERFPDSIEALNIGEK